MAEPKLSDADKKAIREMFANGKLAGVISKKLGLEYLYVYNYANRFKRANADKVRRDNAKSKYAGQITTSMSGYIETGRELPPIQPPGAITHIHADCEYIESGLIAEWGSKLSPITGTLAERKPVMRFTSQDRLS